MVLAATDRPIAENPKLTLCTLFSPSPLVRVHFLDNSSKMFLLDEDTLGKCRLLHSANDANALIITHPSHPTCFPPTPYTAKDLIHTILEKYSVTDSSLVLDYFGIFESLDGHNIGACLNPEDRVVDHVKSWTTEGGNGKATDTAKHGRYAEATYTAASKASLLDKVTSVLGASKETLAGSALPESRR